MRAAYKEKWTIMASNGLNQPYKANITTYRTKIKMA